MDLVQAQLTAHGLGHGGVVAGEHHRLAHPGLLQGLQGGGGAVLDLVGHHQVTGIGPVHRHVDHGAHGLLPLGSGDVVGVHPLLVARQHGAAIHHGLHPVACDLRAIGHPALVGGGLTGGLDGQGDGVAAEALGQGGPLQQFPLRAVHRLGLGDGERAPGQGARLVHDHHARLGQGLQIVAALYQHAHPGRAADAAEEAEGHGDDQGAGAGHHQEDQRPLHPHGEGPKAQHGGQDSQGQGGKNHRRGIVPGKAGDKVLRLGLFGGGVLHQVQDLGHGGLAIGLADFDPQHAGLVDAAADDLLAGGHLAGQRLAGEGRRVQGGGALLHGAVQGDPLAGLDDDGVAHGHLLRVHLDQLPLPLHVGIVGADVHQVRDGLAAAGDGHALEQLPHLVKQHDGHGLGILPAAKSAHGGHRHEEILVKHLAVADVPHGPPQHIPADDGIGDEEQRQAQPAPVLRPDDEQQHIEHRADDDAAQGLFLLSCHCVSPSSGRPEVTSPRPRSRAPPFCRPLRPA